MQASRPGGLPGRDASNWQASYWPSGEADGDGDGDSSAAGELFFEGEGDSSDVAAFFFVDELLVLLPVFLVPVDVVDFLVVALEACVVVAAVSSLCAHETTNAAPASTAINPRTNFFIDNRYLRVRRLRLFDSLPDGKSFVQPFCKSNYCSFADAPEPTNPCVARFCRSIKWR